MVSVVVPLFNKAHTICKTLDSVLTQDFTNLEVVVVDDGSTDAGPELVREVSDARVSLICTSNLGQSAARNTAIKNSTGDLIAFIDADDLWDPDHVSTLVDLYRAHPDAGVVATAYRSIYPGNLILAIRYLEKHIESQLWLLNDYFDVVSHGPYVWVSAVAVPRSVFDQVGLFLEGEHRGADREMWGRIAVKYKVAYSYRISATYNCAAGGQESNKARNLQFPPLIRLLEDLLDADNPSLRNYINRLYFGYAGKALIANRPEEVKRALRGIRARTFPIRLEKLFWLFLVGLPTRYAHQIMRAWGSRYFLGLRNLFRSRRFAIKKLRSLEDK